MIDYHFKSEVLKSGLPKLQKQVSQSLYFNINGKLPFTKYTFDEALNLYKYFYNNYFDEWKEATRINHASFERTLRLRKRITKILEASQNPEYNAIFLTLTFTDKTLNSTSDETRRKYVRRFLKDNCICYVANKDFGARNGREHYHAAVLIKGKINYSKWKYGCLNGQKIRLNCMSDIRVAKYIAKLTNHAIKETCKRNVLIYSRST